jgi:tape measure domain-containing protein
MSNQIRIEYEVESNSIMLATERLEELKRQTIELARQAQAGEKSFKEAIDAQVAVRKEQIGIERLLGAAQKATGEERKRLVQEVVQKEGDLSGAYSRQMGLLEELRAKLKALKTAREQATDKVEVDKYTESIKATQAEINKLTGATDKFKGSNGFWREMRQLVVAAFAIDTVFDFGKSIFDAQSKVENFKLSLNRLVGEPQAKKIFDDLTVAIAKTPLEFDGATKSVEKLIFAYQDAKEPTDNIIKDFVALGNVAKGIPENVTGITKALADTASAGKATAQEFNQFSNAGVNLFALLEESTGKTRKELIKMREDGEISFDLVRTAIVKAGSEGGRFFGAMNIGATTISGKWSNLKDVIFQTSAKIGDSIAAPAKAILDFGITIAQGLGGNLSKLAIIVKDVTATFVAYQVATRLSATWTAFLALKTQALNVVDLAGNVIKAQTSLLLAKLTGDTVILAEAQVGATVATKAFSTALGLSPLGAITLLIGAAVTAYQLYSSSVSDAQEAQKKLITDIAQGVAPIKTQQVEFNNLAKSVLNSNIPIDEQTKALARLKAEHPALLKNVNDLSSAEKILNDNKIKTNTSFDYRSNKLSELKDKYPLQLKGVNSLEEAEAKLGLIVRDTNRDFITLSLTMENNIKIQAQLAGADENFAKKIESLAKIKKLRADDSISLANFVGGMFVSNDVLIKAEEKKALAYDKTAQEFVKAVQKIQIENERLSKEIIYKAESDKPKLNKIAEDGNADRSKAKVLSTDETEKKVTAILERANVTNREGAIKAVQAEAESDKAKVVGKKDYANRVKIIDAQLKADLLKVSQKYDKQEEDDRIKTKKESDAKYEAQAKTNAERLWDIIEKRINDEAKALADLNKDKEKLDEDYAKEQKKNNAEHLKLADGLRLLDRLSHAKNSKEVLKIEKEEKERIFQEELDFYKKKKDLSDLNFDKVKAKYRTDSKEYKQALLEKEQADAEYTEVNGQLVKKRIDDVKDEISQIKFWSIKEIDEIAKFFNTSSDKVLEYLPIVGAFAKQIFDNLFSVNDVKLQKELDKAGTALEKFRAEQDIKDSATEKKTLGFFAQLAEGKWAEAIGSLFSVIKDLGENPAILAQAAIMKDNLAALEKIMALIDSDAQNINSSLATIQDVYAQILTGAKLPEIVNNLPKTFEELYNSEIKHGQQIQENYKKAVDSVDSIYKSDIDRLNKTHDFEVKNENDKYNLVVDVTNKAYDNSVAKEKEKHDFSINNINDRYDLETKRINDVYALLSEQANEQFNKDTLGILQKETDGLSALITNEGSKTAVFKDFAERRANIEKTFILANKDIATAGSQAEIDAIFAARDAKDAALSSLQKDLNTELAFIVSSEGQKRKEYTATEIIQRATAQSINDLGLKFSADAIQRELDKKDATLKNETIKKEGLKLIESDYNNFILIQTQFKNVALETLKASHDAIILSFDNKLKDDLTVREATYNNDLRNLALEKDAAILLSFTTLRILLQGEINQITGAMQDSANLSAAAFEKLRIQLETITALYKALGNGGAGVPTITIPSTDFDFNTLTIPTGFKDGTHRLSNISGKMGVDTEIIRADVGERIMPTNDNNELRSAYGRDITNTEMKRYLIEYATSKNNLETNNNVDTQKTNNFYEFSQNSHLEKNDSIDKKNTLEVNRFLIESAIEKRIETNNSVNLHQLTNDNLTKEQFTNTISSEKNNNTDRSEITNTIEKIAKLQQLRSVYSTDSSTKEVSKFLKEQINTKNIETIKEKILNQKSKELSQIEVSKFLLNKTQMPKFMPFTPTKTNDIRTLIGQELKMKVEMEMMGMQKAIKDGNRQLINAIESKPETQFFADSKGFSQMQRRGSTIIKKKLSNYLVDV